jgi:transcription elongation factor GreB
MARACVKKEIDDDVIVKTPNGIKEWFVTNIDYISS